MTKYLSVLVPVEFCLQSVLFSVHLSQLSTQGQFFIHVNTTEFLAPHLRSVTNPKQFISYFCFSVRASFSSLK